MKHMDTVNYRIELERSKLNEFVALALQQESTLGSRKIIRQSKKLDRLFKKQQQAFAKEDKAFRNSYC